MEPGSWYGVGDITRALGEPRSSRGVVQQVLLPRGLVRRARNPARGVRLNPWQIMAGGDQEPDWLYRLTEKGEAYRSRLMSAAPGQIKRESLGSQEEPAGST
jgi:hypothetical protein